MSVLPQPRVLFGVCTISVAGAKRNSCWLPVPLRAVPHVPFPFGFWLHAASTRKVVLSLSLNTVDGAFSGPYTWTLPWPRLIRARCVLQSSVNTETDVALTVVGEATENRQGLVVWDFFFPVTLVEIADTLYIFCGYGFYSWVQKVLSWLWGSKDVIPHPSSFFF